MPPVPVSQHVLRSSQSAAQVLASFRTGAALSLQAREERGLKELLLEGFPAACHLVEVDYQSHIACAVGFLGGIVAKETKKGGCFIWVRDSYASSEAGCLYGLGFSSIGIDPDKLILVDAKAPKDVLWSVEEALRSNAVSGVVGEIHGGSHVIDLTATRRLSLRCASAKVPVFLAASRLSSQVSTAAKTRWRIGPAPCREPGDRLLGSPAWQVTLTKNRYGLCTSTTVRFSPKTQSFFTGNARELSQGLKGKIQREEDRGNIIELAPPQKKKIA